MVEVAVVSRRAVVRSERYMEWQRELISHAAARKASEESEAPVPANKCNLVINKSGSGDEACAAGANGNENGAIHKVKSGLAGSSKQAQQQQQSKRINGKRLREALSEGGSQMRRNKADDEDDEEEEHKDDSGVRVGRTHRRVTNQENNNSDRNFRFLTRGRGVSPPLPAMDIAGATTTASKRSKRVAQRLANEEPPPPPLKLPKLHLVLTRKEIQEDWVKITGHKYAGKPKKSTLVQRGFGLCTSLTCPSSIRYLNDPQ